MTDEQPKQSVQSVQSAWVLCLRREAERLLCDDMARITFVGLLIATHTDAKGAGAFMAPETLAGITGYSVDMVRRCIAALVGVGLLHRQRRQGKTSLYQLFVPATSDPLDWGPHLAPFETARQAAARRRAKSAAKSGNPVATGTENTRRDGGPQGRTPVASGNREHPSRRGTQDSEHPSRRVENTRRVGEFRTPVASGGYLDQSSTSGRDPDNYQERAGLVAQPQVGAREAPGPDQPPGPGLQALPGGGHGQAGDHQAPLLLPVQAGPPAPADLARIAEHMTGLYGVIVPRRFAAPVALDVLGDLDLPDPTAYVIAALDADPGRYRPPAPAETHGRAAGAS